MIQMGVEKSHVCSDLHKNVLQKKKTLKKSMVFRDAVKQFIVLSL